MAKPRIVKPPTPTVTDRLNRASDRFYNYLAPRVVEPVEQAARGNWSPLERQLSPMVSPAVGQVPINTPAGQAPLWKYAGVKVGQMLFDWLYPRTIGSAESAAFAARAVPGMAALGRLAPIANNAAPFIMLAQQGGDRAQIDWAKQQGLAPIKTQQNPYPWLRADSYQQPPSSKWRYMRAYD